MIYNETYYLHDEKAKKFIEDFMKYVQFFLIGGDWVKLFYEELQRKQDTDVIEIHDENITSKQKKDKIKRCEKTKKLLGGKIRTLDKIRNDLVSTVFVEQFSEDQRDQMIDFMDNMISLYMDEPEFSKCRPAMLVLDPKGSIKREGKRWKLKHKDL